jgi:hypothetical protein
MAKQAVNIRLFSLEQIPHPGANLQKANARGNHGIDWDIKVSIVPQALHLALHITYML